MIQRRSMLQAGLVGLGLTHAKAMTVRTLPSHNVRELGAKGDGTAKDTRALQLAIDRAFEAGGGIAYVPPGRYLCGTLQLKTNTTLYLEAGATILGSTDLADYVPVTGPSPKDDANDKHLIVAHRAENITLAGAGTIDGQGSAFWVRSGRSPVASEDLWRDVATYDWKPLPRPSPMLEFAECRNVHIEGITLKNSPGWCLRPIACDSVFIHGITIRNLIHAPNGDGIDPSCSQNVMISNCDIAVADDTICLKSDNPYGDLRVTKNITITNCVLTTCCNGFKIGTGTRGGFENVTFSNSVIYNGNVPLNERVISGVAIEMVDGGWLDGIIVSNIRMQNARTPLFVRLGARHGAGRLRGVRISDIDARGAILTSSITGLPDHPAEDITLSNIHIETKEGGKAEWSQLQVPEQEKQYPEARMFGRLPAYGLYCRHVTGLRLSDLNMTSTVEDPRPLLVCDDVEDLRVDSLAGTGPGPQQALIGLRNVRNAFFTGCVAPPHTEVYARVSGEKSSRISIVSSDLSCASTPVETVEGASRNEIFLAANREASAS